MATQQDVARLAGTSAAVVSYVLNNGPRPVSDATRAKVLAAVAELDFRPNTAARSLRSGRSRVLGLVVPDLHSLFAEVVRTFEETAYARGYVILTGNTANDPAREAEYLALMRSHQVDGVLLTVDPTASLDRVLGHDIPVVVLDQPSPGLPVSTVSVDYERAARDATRHLIDAGHRDVAFVGGPAGFPSSDARYDGWLHEVAAAGLDPDRAHRAEFSREDGYRVGLELLADARRPTGVFVSSDQQAIGVLRAATELGIRCPDELSLVAFDDSDDCLYTAPQLTTVRQPMAAMIERSVELLLTPPDAPRHEIFEHDLVVRGSVAPTTPEHTTTDEKAPPRPEQHRNPTTGR